MKHLIVLVLLLPSLAMAVDDANVQAIDSKASQAKSKSDQNASEIESLKGGLPAEREARIAADNNLQLQIDNIELTPGPKGDKGDPGADGLPGIDGLDGFVVYAIGDIGPAGGWVFYVTNDGLHGLEAAPVDQANAEWGCFGTDISGATSTAIGAGARNTDDIVRGCPTAGIAAAVADEYISSSGYIDWYLPSKDELNEMHLNIGQGSMTIGNVGGFASNLYWSSSEASGSNAWFQDFTSGAQYAVNLKLSTYGVRAVRAF